MFKLFLLNIQRRFEAVLVFRVRRVTEKVSNIGDQTLFLLYRLLNKVGVYSFFSRKYVYIPRFLEKNYKRQQNGAEYGILYRCHKYCGPPFLPTSSFVSQLSLHDCVSNSATMFTFWGTISLFKSSFVYHTHNFNYHNSSLRKFSHLSTLRPNPRRRSLVFCNVKNSKTPTPRRQSFAETGTISKILKAC